MGVAEMKEQVGVDPVILGYDMASLDGDKSVVVIEYEIYERLKRLDENVKREIENQKKYLDRLTESMSPLGIRQQTAEYILNLEKLLK
jgi:hypothetical protein